MPGCYWRNLSRIASGDTLERSLDDPFQGADRIGEVALTIDLEGRTPSQVNLSLRYGNTTVVLHQGADHSLTQALPRRFVTSAFSGSAPTGRPVTLSVEVPSEDWELVFERWYLEALE